MADTAYDPYASSLNAMGLANMMKPNPYTSFPNQKLRFPGYVGTPTDARGNPIAPPAGGTTLNATAQTPAAAPAAQPHQLLTPVRGTGQVENTFGHVEQADPYGIQGYTDPIDGSLLPRAAGQLPQGMDAQTQAMIIGPLGMQHLKEAGISPAGQAPTSPVASGDPSSMMGGDLNSALGMLSQPGKPPMFGASVPEQSLAAQPSVLDSFLATHGGGHGAGNYSNQGFFDTLNQLRGQTPGHGATGAVGATTSGY